MSFFKFKSLVLFIKIVTKLLLLRPFGILIYCCYCSDAECPLLTLTVSRLCLWPREQRSHYPGEISKRKNHQSFFNLCSRKTRARGSRDYRDDICFEKLRFQINKLTSVFHASVLLLIMNFVIVKVAVEWSASYFDNVMTKFIVNNRETDANLFFMIVRSRSLPHRTNYKLMCLSAFE